MREGAPQLKRLSLELGGNAPFIVFDDADLERSVEGAMMAKFRNSGQTCVSANRFYVHERIYDDFAERLQARMTELVVGPGTDPQTDLGPLIDDRAVAKMERHLADALEKGGQLRIGGNRHARGGTYFEPTLVTEAAQAMRVAHEETFAPLAPLIRFREEAEVVEMANDTDVGLAAYFYSRDLGRVWRVAEAIESGIVGVNTAQIANEAAPFGGVKQSGFGREGSKYGIGDYLDIKYVCLRGIGA
jgi:succinate-semialdehyde dehydrogenase/glutarate-semialdehyde dehydrogenase